MDLNIMIFFLLLLGTCKPKSINVKIDFSTIDEYLVNYKNGIPNDTLLNRQSFFDLDGNLTKQIDYYRKQVLQTIICVNEDTIDLQKYLSKKDSIIYLVKGKTREKRFYNGKLIDEKFYDVYNNIVKEINYNINAN